MPRSRILTGLVLAAVAAASALVVILGAWRPEGGDDQASRVGTLPAAAAPGPQAPPASGEPSSSGETPPAIAARGVVSPRIVLFGDTVQARVDLVLDRDRVDPDSVRVASAFSPWAVVGEPARVRRDAGPITYLTTTYVLRCLTSPCVPPVQTSQVEFDPARATYAAPGAGDVPKSLRVDWPVVTVYSRVAAASFVGRAELATPWRVDVLTMPAVSYRSRPGVVLALLLLLGLLLAAIGIALAYVAWPRRAPAPPPEPEAPPPPPLSPLEQALALLEDAARTDGAEDRRRALELVAEVLDESGGDDDLARSARVLAWSENAPEVDETTGLAIRVRSALELEEAGMEGEENGRVV